MMLKEDVITIVISLTDKTNTYYRHAVALISSIVNNTKYPIKCYVISDDTLGLEAKTTIKEVGRENCDEIIFIQIDEHYFDDIIKHQSNSSVNVVSKASLYRLLIPKLLTEKKAIYLDTDIIVDMDIHQLWSVNFKDNLLAAVRDVPSALNMVKKLKFYKKAKIESSSYFNAGVLLLNLDKIREEMDLFNKSYEFFTKYEDAPMLDQDALNYVFKGKTQLLESNFNRIIDEDYYLNDDLDCLNSIWHYAGPLYKPWNGIHTDLDKKYWKYLIMGAANNHELILKSINLVTPYNYSLDRIISIQKIAQRRKFLKLCFKRIFQEVFRKKW